MITIVDYGIGNLGSVLNLFKKVGVESRIVSDHAEIDKAEKILFPGVGAFRPAIQRLQELGMVELLTRKVKVDKVPVLGICLGMQLMTLSSEEGGPVDGLGWIDARTVRFQLQDKGLKVPHKGWNYVHVQKDTPLFQKDEELRFYFDHSYHVKLNDNSDELLSAQYGNAFTASFQHENIWGVQFHPEKSHRYGMQLLKNFALI